MPYLDDTHISLLKHENKNLATKSFEEFVLGNLQPQQKKRPKP